jgi:acetyltransferase-like isoleucine patch superfamily enzyme
MFLDQNVAAGSSTPASKSKALVMTPIKIRAHRLSLPRRAALAVRQVLIDLRLWRLRKMAGMDIGTGTKISLRANLDMTNPRGIHIGNGTLISFNAVVFAHDLSRHFHTHTYIGSNCFIGAHAIIMPGLTVGDQCIVGAGSVVTKNVPSGSIVAGNPARILRSGVKTREWGILVEAYEEAVENAKSRDPGES